MMIELNKFVRVTILNKNFSKNSTKILTIKLIILSKNYLGSDSQAGMMNSGVFNSTK